MDINDVHEENCLLRYALTTDGVVDIYTWFWTDGNVLFCLMTMEIGF